MNRWVKNAVRSLVVVVLLLATSSCATQPKLVADTQACQWPYGCNVRAEKGPELPKTEGRAGLPADTFALPNIEGRAGLPPDTFALGPPSGSKLGDEINGRRLPFEHQPAQGFSAVLDAGAANTYWVMTDSGYGTKANSSDFQLRMYRIRADFEVGRGSRGDISIEEWITLRDPDRHISFPITNEDTKDRILTGADFDPESVRRDPAGDLWFGDEYGPFLLHTDATGRVLEAPFPLPDVRTPESPDLGWSEVANLPSSEGFEGMAISQDGKYLYPMLGDALIDDPDQRRRFIYEFDLQKKRYTGEYWQYQTDDPEHTITELSPLAGDPQHRLLVVERSSTETKSAQFVRVYLVDLRHTDASGFLTKRQVLELPEPQIESILAIGNRQVLVLNDNDYPYTLNATEAVVIKLEGLPKES
jgi:glycerophosphoryl diester phosphodiesterase